MDPVWTYVQTFVAFFNASLFLIFYNVNIHERIYNSALGQKVKNMLFNSGQKPKMMTKLTLLSHSKPDIIYNDHNNYNPHSHSDHPVSL